MTNCGLCTWCRRKGRHCGWPKNKTINVKSHFNYAKTTKLSPKHGYCYLFLSKTRSYNVITRLSQKYGYSDQKQGLITTRSSPKYGYSDQKQGLITIDRVYSYQKQGLITIEPLSNRNRVPNTVILLKKVHITLRLSPKHGYSSKKGTYNVEIKSQTRLFF